MQIKGELFSQQFIPKLLDGTKIRTSRPCKIEFLPGFNVEWTGYRPVLEYGEFFLEGSNHRDATKRIKPKYQLGDIMYVRETWQKQFGICWYKATPTCGDATPPEKWRPSLHMPREAARIFLRVTDIKVQRLDGLTERDAIEDGFEAIEIPQCPHWDLTSLERFSQFWVKTYGWDAQWMWVYYFERCERE